MRYVALLRGINVTGNKMIKMEELRAVFEALGFKNVTSYINSGNLAFDTRSSSESGLIAKIEKGIEDCFSMSVQVMVRPQGDINDILANNPFKGEYASHKEMHVMFLKEKMPRDKQELVLTALPEKERCVFRGREIYCHLPMGVAESVLGRGLVEKKAKIPVTARNWRTVEKLADL
jgi:uncharacterized protein (DUF1697 family)